MLEEDIFIQKAREYRELVKANNPPTVVEQKSEVHLEHGVTVKKSTHVPAGVPTGAWHPSTELTTMPVATTRLPSVERSTQSQSPPVSSRINRPTPGGNKPNDDPGVTGAALMNLPVNLDKNRNADKTRAGPNNRQEATCERPDIRVLSTDLRAEHFLDV